MLKLLDRNTCSDSSKVLLKIKSKCFTDSSNNAYVQEFDYIKNKSVFNKN